MTAPKSTTENAVPIAPAVEPIRISTTHSQSVGPEESRVVADTDAQGTTSTGPTAAANKIPWKEQVIAYAKKTRGAVLRKPTLKEHGDQILTGEASAWEPTRKE
ncbi:hypothetical protein V8E53_006895 [Lactarius tabidus]